MTPATLQAPMHTTDPVGGESLAWGAPIPIYASAKQIGSRQKLSAGLPITETIWTIACCWRPEVASGWRINLKLFGQRHTLDIVGQPQYRPDAPLKERMILTAQTGTAEAMDQSAAPPAPVIPAGALLAGEGWLALGPGALVIA